MIVLLAALLTARNENYLFNFNVANLLTAATALGFIALGQNIALLTGGIDLSVGPLAGFLVVVASFFVNDGKSGAAVLLGLVLMAATAALTGAVNGSLIRFARFTPIAATLVLYIALRRARAAAATGAGRLHQPVVPGRSSTARPGRSRWRSWSWWC